MFQKVMRILEVQKGQESAEPSTSTKVWVRLPLFLYKRRVPLPERFCLLIDSKWEHPAKNKESKRPSTKFYALALAVMQRLRLPVVDALVAALDSISVLPADSEGLPEDSVDWQTEMAVRKAFKALAGTLKTSVAGSMFIRACFLWTQDLLKMFEILDEVRKEITKISSVVAFALDATADAVQLSAWAMAASVTARWNTWLHHWDIDGTNKGNWHPIQRREALWGGIRAPSRKDERKKGLTSQERINKPQTNQSSRSFWNNKPQSSGVQSNSASSSSPSYYRSSRKPWQCKSTFKPHGQHQQQFTPRGVKPHSS